MLSQIFELVRKATMAASGHNTQPWRFAVRQNVVEIYPDYGRQLPVVDPNNRELWISLGCALENLLQAAHEAGYVYSVRYPEAAEHISIELEPGESPDDNLAAEIPQRQNNRSEYNAAPIPGSTLEKLRSTALEPGIMVRWLQEPDAMQAVESLVREGDLAQYSHRAFVHELIAWLRFNHREAEAQKDGLYSRCSGNPEAPRWLGRLFVAAIRPQRQADIDCRKVRSSSGCLVIASDEDGRVAWVKSGQVYQRLALTMAIHGITSACMNQPVEVSRLRVQLQSTLELGKLHPQMLVRFGYAEPMPRSLRRPLEAVLIVE
ncbi:MAG: hypothetical protein WHT81_04075 [Rectinemataceae bacterium]